MAIISSKKPSSTDKIKLDLDQTVLDNVKKYCAWANIENMDYFFEEAARFIFKKDRDWKKHVKSISK